VVTGRAKGQATGGSGYWFQLDQAVELKSTKAGYELVSFGLEPLAQDTVVDGAIMDAPQVANAITKILILRKLKQRTWPLRFPGTR